MGWMTNVAQAIMKRMLNFKPAPEQRALTINEPLSHRANVVRNLLWYRGDASELDQFFKQTWNDAVSKSRFWASVPSADLQIRKIHSGLPSMIVDRLADMVVSDMERIELDIEEITANWDAIERDNRFMATLSEAIISTLITGDGAFKVSVDTSISKYPIIEFFSAEHVEYTRNRGRLQEVIFYTDYRYGEKDYKLKETFGRGFITYKLYNADGKEVPLTTIPDTTELVDVTFPGEFIMAVPMHFFKSQKWPERGKSLFDTKSDTFDALDEVISQWIDAVRAGRVQKYIPEDLVPRNPETGTLQKPNPFDNQFIKLQTSMGEDSKGQISMVQPQILYEAFMASYASAMDMCLQGIMSPATLGIDLKKTDNAEAQREKEKATLYTRNKIIDTLNEVIPQLVEVALKVYDTMRNRTPGEYEATVEFGEYASPSFDAIVETIGKAKGFGIMSIERVVESLYGDTLTDEEKAAEVQRLKDEQGLGDPADTMLNENQDTAPDGVDPNADNTV